jgi:SAM-dependent methyltransferase
MKVSGYFNYFIFLQRNWDLRIALFVIYYEIIGEKKYHLSTIGIDDLKNLGDKTLDVSHATMYMPLNYFILDKLMKQVVKYPNNKTFLDIGCGKGRAISVAACYDFEKITGVDFSKELCDDAVNNTNRLKQKFPSATFNIINEDAFDFEIPDDVTTIFLFNPFDKVITYGVLQNIMNSYKRNPRTIRVLYANPQYKSIFFDEGFVEIYRIKKLEYLEASILEKKPD